MARRGLTRPNQQVNGLHSKDRRGFYRSPSERDERCSHFEGNWIQIADTGYGDDIQAICENPSAVCDYKKTFVDGLITICQRYLKTGDDGYTLTSVGLPQLTNDRQDIRLTYDMVRLFKDKIAKVRMTLSKRMLSYQWLVGNSNFTRFTGWSEDGLPTVWTASGSMYQSAENTSRRTGLYMKGMETESEYQFTTRFNIVHSDNDIIGVIFRYNPVTKHYYSVEWDNGGWGYTGVRVMKNIYNASTGDYSRTQIAAYPGITWQTFHDPTFIVNVYNTYATIRVSYAWPHGNHYHNSYYQFVVDLNDSRLDEGTYGLMSQSQMVNVFYMLGHIPVEGNRQIFDKDIPLELLTYDGTNYILSESMEEAFKQVRDNYLAANGMTRAELTREDYNVLSDNVYEQVQFNDGTLFTTDPSLKLSLQTWGYDVSVLYEKVMDINGHTPRTETDVYVIAKDIYVKSVKVEFAKPQYEDKFILDVSGERIFNLSATGREYLQVFEEPKEASGVFNIVFHYIIDESKISFFSKDEAIDTHDKIFTVRGNELAWHHIPSRE